MKKIIIFLSILVCMGINIYAEDSEVSSNDNALIEVKENGDVSITEVDDNQNKMVTPSKGRASVSIGVVNFAATTGNVTYIEEATGREGYTNANSGADGAYLGTVGDKVRFMQGGVIGLVNSSLVQVVNYDDISSVNFYRVDNGRIRHYVTTNLANNTYVYPTDIGPKQSYMIENQVYYSYDGHYFYTTFENMIVDYKNGTYRNAINPSTPYYNYFQYLSHRTKTNFTASQFNGKINDIVGEGASVMLNQGSYFIKYQNDFGANALLMFGVAANESNWGRSEIALAKNNLFGHGAVDSAPGANANGYEKASQSIYGHAYAYISTGYVNPADWRYYGPNLGDKSSGMNVKYASDPYWGEKAAAQAYYLEMENGNKNIDYGKYTLGVKSNYEDKIIYSEAKRSSSSLYTTGTVKDFSFTILETVEGESINGNNVWYKIQSDASLNDSRTNIETGDGGYDSNISYAYVHSSNIQIVFNGEKTAVEKITINPTSATISTGKTFKASAIVAPNSASDKSVIWSSGNEKVLKIDNGGNVTAVGVGKTYIYAKSKNGVVGKSLITVVQAPSKLTINPTALTMTTGNSYTPKVILYPSNASTSLTWKSGNEKVVTVDEKGCIKAIGAGSTYVYATASNGVEAKTLVTVLKAPERIVVNPSSAKLSIGNSFQAKALIYPENAYDKTVSWTTSDPSIATVSSTGVVSAKSAGTVDISAITKNSKVSICKVTVLPFVEKLTVNPTAAVISIGKKFQAQPYYFPNNAINKSVTWKSDNEEIATVKNGEITANKAGTTLIHLYTSNNVETSISIRVVD